MHYLGDVHPLWERETERCKHGVRGYSIPRHLPSATRLSPYVYAGKVEIPLAGGNTL